MSSGAIGAKYEIRIDGQPLEVKTGISVLRAALEAGIYIPHLCDHPDLPPSRSAEPTDEIFRGGEKIVNDPARPQAFAGCGLCVVRVEGVAEPQPSCDLPVFDGLAVHTEGPDLKEFRQQKLAAILARHPHACITCAQKEGCSREPCSSNVAPAERCCPLLGRCELEKVASFVGVPADTPRYVPRGLAAVEDLLIAWAPELCVGCLRCVRACGEIKGVGAMGFVRRGDEVIVGLIGPDRAAAGCRWCGACIEVCPTGALTDRGVSIAARESQLVPCRSGCPAGVDVPRFLRAVADERPEDAARIMLDRLPLPHALGRVCYHPCERACRRSDLGGALAVCRLRRFVFESDVDSIPAWPEAPAAGGRVAVVGGGPSGLAAAHFLRRLGRQVTIFEAAPEAGGMLRYGIPAYRLPRDVLAKDLDLLARQGIEIRTGMALGRELDLDGLREEGFDAILLAVGAGGPKPLAVKGSDLGGIVAGVDFLHRVAAGDDPGVELGGRSVLVIGGGNVAVDAARTACRLGAETVTLACLETPEEMPAYESEIAAAREEGIGMLTSWGPRELFGEGTVAGVRLVRCLSVFDEAGRFAPRFDEETTREVQADAVILAIGQEVEPGFRENPELKLEYRADGFLRIGEEDLGTGLVGVFACGEVCVGPSSVVESVASGRKAAERIDRFLGGSGEIPTILEPEQPVQRIGRDKGFGERLRVVAGEAPVRERISDFAEVEHGLAADAARTEAGRCLQCDLRLFLAQAVLPPLPWLELNEEEVAAVPEIEGVYQLLGEDRIPIRIVGTPNLRAALRDELDTEAPPPYFVYDEDPMYTKRESELIQQFLAAHGRMPEGDDDLDDLF